MGKYLFEPNPYSGIVTLSRRGFFVDPDSTGEWTKCPELGGKA